ncbi:hypothetical protein ACJX0J_021596, partial [Zea mays]
KNNIIILEALGAMFLERQHRPVKKKEIYYITLREKKNCYIAQPFHSLLYIAKPFHSLHALTRTARRATIIPPDHAGISPKMNLERERKINSNYNWILFSWTGVTAGFRA